MDMQLLSHCSVNRPAAMPGGFAIKKCFRKFGGARSLIDTAGTFVLLRLFHMLLKIRTWAEKPAPLMRNRHLSIENLASFGKYQQEVSRVLS